MSNPKKKILVPTDFTTVVDYALDHAAALADHMDAEIHLLHLIGKDEDVDKVRDSLEQEVARLKAFHDRVRVVPFMKSGDVYEDIGATAEEIGANLIVMGTHGMHGMQFITGSRALRMITNSKASFIVVQERKIKPEGYRDIVVPMDLQRETREKVTIAAEMARYFNGKVHVIVPTETDEFLHKQLQNNIVFARKYFGDRGIDFDATVSDSDTDHFVPAILEYAKQIDADLITVVNMAQTNIFGVLGIPFEEDIITNEAMIPVMLMNPRKIAADAGGWTFQ